MSNLRVLLIHANSTLDTMIPPNLAVMSSYLKRDGNEVKLFDTTFYKTKEKTGDEARVNTLQVKETNFEDLGIFLNKSNMYDDFMETVKEYQPDIIGLSAISLTYPFGIEFLKRLRKDGDSTPAIVGGIHTTVSPEEVLRESCVDYICVGEGELAFVELCSSLRDGTDTTNIKNIWSKKDGKIQRTPLRPPIDMDTLLFQDWSIFDERRVYRPMGGEMRRIGSFELNRGCPYSCAYCTNSFWNALYKGKNFRQRSVRKFIDEVKTIKEEYGLGYVHVGSETFLARNDASFNEFVKLWKEEIDIPFWIQTRPETITEERIRALKEIGLHSLSVGVESGSPEVRRLLNRKTTNQQIISAFKIFEKLDVKVGVNNIVGSPFDSREHFFETVELNRIINAKNILTHVFNAYRGTPLYNFCVERGYLSKDSIGGDYRQDYALTLPHLSKDDVLGMQRTLALYVKMPRHRWKEIAVAEKFDEEGNTMFSKLKEEYTKNYLK